MQFARGLIAAAVMALAVAPLAQAQAAALQTAIERNDLPGLRVAAAAGSADEKAVAAAVELAWLHKDADAVVALASAAQGRIAPGLKAAALMTLSGVQMRRGEFAGAVEFGKAGVALSTGAAEMTQTIAFVSALIGEAPTKAVGTPSGHVPVTRDLAKLPRADMSVNGKPQDAVLDTGADFSTVVESAAERLGLRPLDAKVSVGSTYTDKLNSKLAIADSLVIGGAEFRNVVFIVLPDKDLTLLGGKYKIEMILGMPVFLEMGRIEISKQDGAEWFTFGRSGAAPSAEPNVILDGLSPQIIATIEGKPLVLMIDSGAQRTSFNAHFAADFKERMDQAQAGVGAVGGAGGIRQGVKQDRLSDVPLKVGNQTATISTVAVGPETRRGRHGLLGEDVLGVGFVLDFDAMRLDLKP